MDGDRFDGFARAIATWTSRRRLVGGLTGAAAGSLLGRRGVRAQGSDATPTPTPALLADIAGASEKPNKELTALRDAIAAYQTSQGQAFNPLAFDPRLDQFLRDLITLTEKGMNATSWTTEQLYDFLLSISLVVGAVSAGGDTDVTLYQFAVTKLGGEATPAVPADCITPHRPGTCTASCLDVWVIRETTLLSAPSDIMDFILAFYNFLECYVYFGSANVQSGCLASLVDMGCIPEVICGCTGDCY